MARLTLQQSLAISGAVRNGVRLTWDYEHFWLSGTCTFEVHLHTPLSDALRAVGFKRRNLPIEVDLPTLRWHGVERDEMVREIEAALRGPIGHTDQTGYLDLEREAKKQAETLLRYPQKTREWSWSEIETLVEQHREVLAEALAVHKARIAELEAEIEAACAAIDEEHGDWESQTRSGGATTDEEHHTEGRAAGLWFALEALGKVGA